MKMRSQTTLDHRIQEKRLRKKDGDKTRENCTTRPHHPVGLDSSSTVTLLRSLLILSFLSLLNSWVTGSDSNGVLSSSGGDSRFVLPFLGEKRRRLLGDTVVVFCDSIAHLCCRELFVPFRRMIACLC